MIFKKYIPIVIFLISLLLVLKVSLKSSFNSHPDEDSHFLVAQFYKTYNYIPAVNDTNADFTYNEVFGRSYINLLGLEYIIMGKFYAILDFLPLEDFQIVRLFNFFLFMCLGFYLFLKQEFRIFKFSLLLTPQLLYIASYINNDFFAYAMGSIVLIQILSPNSFLNKYMKHAKLSYGFFLIFPISLFLLIISKYNYIPLILAVIIFLIFKFKKNLFRLFIIMLISLSLFGARIAYDYHLNGFNKTELIESKANALGKEGYRPQDKNQVTNRVDLFLSLKDRGIRIHELFTVFPWHKSSFQSFFGKYGYMTINSEAWTYDVYLLFSIALFCFIFLSLKKNFNFINFSKVFVGIGLMLLMLSLSLAHSWVNDFQPQGKYLFPIIGILFLLFHSLKIHSKGLYFLLITINIFTIYSYYTNCVLAFAR